MTEQTSSPLVVSRRGLVRGAGTATLSATAIALLSGCESLARMDGAKVQSSDIDILNAALAAENQAIAAYQLAADSRLLAPGTLRIAQGFQADHGEHAKALRDTITRLGGAVAPAKTAYDFPVASLKTQTDVLRFAADLERGAVAAYLAAVPKFQDRDIAQAAASILGAEAQHLAVLRNALGENPVPSAFVS
jgi:outer membrane murein-binding lipoprotein Lpp